MILLFLCWFVNLIEVVNNKLLEEFNVVLMEFWIMLMIKLMLMICMVMLLEMLNKLYVSGINNKELLVIFEVL